MIKNYFKNKIKPCNSIANFPSKKKCSTEAVNCTQISLHVATPSPRRLHSNWFSFKFIVISFYEIIYILNVIDFEPAVFEFAT